MACESETPKHEVVAAGGAPGRGAEVVTGGTGTAAGGAAGGAATGRGVGGITVSVESLLVFGSQAVPGKHRLE